jgi:amino acid adenylation domain-containing protein
MKRKVGDLLALPPEGLRHVIGMAGEHASVGFHAWEELLTEPDGFERHPSISGQDLAYIMYTSGSTGAPKGIMHTHFSGLSYARLSALTYAIGRDDCIGNHSPLHFDMSTLGYLTGPYAQATTVIVPDAHTKLPTSLAQLVATQKISIWYSVPLALNQMLNSGVLDTLDFSQLRWVLFGGEPIQPKTLRSLMQHWKNARFGNVYGPAEVNQCTYYNFPSASHGGQWPGETPVPLGQIWNDTEAKVLDHDDQPVSPGEAGELVVSSPTMMKGYWNRPDLNGDAFYSEPAADGQGKRFYRTGDLVQTTQKGELTFIGRKDRQIKIRGYRVELEEIESALSSHPSIMENGVFKTTDAEGRPMILASCIPLPGHETSEDELRKYLALRLPAYAVPSRIELRDELPRTGSGKVDRGKLTQLVTEGGYAGNERGHSNSLPQKDELTKTH